MLVGIISDSHDNQPMIIKAMDTFKSRGVENILHAGDIISPFSAKKIAGVEIPVIAVFGNNDGEKHGLQKSLNIEKGPRKFELGGVRFVMVHDEERIRSKDRSDVDVVIVGHTHKVVVDNGPPLVINPGECGAWLTGKSTIAILDSGTMKVEIITL